ncbi:hypothetical protein L596_021849 [Steinernema carpocapsae]|uniref:UPAR/Ly6 domain-containing protein n=1 Tax=Steinernema carpocapsae TaxID=34508 RepID=A0A4V6A085_STECR|nr:hypothetical protein L596_021849 [Steinernema carpocapsae]
MLQRPLLVLLILAAVLNVASAVQCYTSTSDTRECPGQFCSIIEVYNPSAQVASYAKGIPLAFKTCGLGFVAQMIGENPFLATLAAPLKQSECTKTTSVAKKVNVSSLGTVGVRLECCMGDRCNTGMDPFSLARLFETIPAEEIPNLFNRKDDEEEVMKKNGAPEVGVFGLFMAVSLAR